MPRSNRPRHQRGGGGDEAINLSRVLKGRAHTEQKRDGLWNVQPLAAASATKYYLCPGCATELAPGMAHVVSWRADGLLGEADDVAARRHWHTHCWKIRL